MVALAVGAVALLMALAFVKQLQADGYKALYDGRWIAQHGIPQTEALTSAAHGRPWVDEQWLAELIYFRTWQLGGLALVAILGALAVAASYVALAALMLRRCASVVAATCCSVLAIVMGLGWTFTRAQNLALPLFALMLVICLTDAEYTSPTKRLVWLVPLLAIWANVHGSVLLGGTLTTLYVLYRAGSAARNGMRRPAARCAALAMATALAPLATPYGLHLFHYYSEFIGNRAMAAATAEWDAPAFPSPDFFELYGTVALLAVLIVRSSLRGRRPSVPLLVGAALTAAVASLESGSIVWFGMVAALLLADLTRRNSPRASATWPGVLSMGASALAVSAFVMTILATRSDAQYEGLIPVRVLHSAATYASSHPCVRVLADNWDASALLWHDPGLAGRIGFDARLEQYPPAALSRWIAFQVGPGHGWIATTRGYQLLIGNTRFTPLLVSRLRHMPRGHVLQRSGLGVAVVSQSASGSQCEAAWAHS